MIFQGKSIHDITDEEIIELVSNHISERQHLEFKCTINHREDEDRLEILRDIISFANSGGGYIIIGIRDDGAGKAQKFEPELVGEKESIKKSITSLCQDYISEIIDGLEIVSREVNNNPLVIICIPSSERVPHMVNYNNRTDFFIRHYDGKREMTIGEIRESFTKDKVSLRLLTVEKQINLLSLIFIKIFRVTLLRLIMKQLKY